MLLDPDMGMRKVERDSLSPKAKPSQGGTEAVVSPGKLVRGVCGAALKPQLASPNPYLSPSLLLGFEKRVMHWKRTWFSLTQHLDMRKVFD